MNICYIAHDSNLTGANRSLLDILSCCKSNGIKPLVILPKKGKIEIKLQEMNIEYKVIRYTGNIKSSFLKNILKNAINTVAAIKISRLLKEYKIDIAHNNSILIDVGMKAAKKINIPYVCHIREFGMEDHNLEFINENKLYNYLESANAVIAISKSVYKKFSNLVPKANMLLIYNGVNLDEHIQSNKKIFINDKVNLLLAGRICNGKGQLDAVKAINHLVNKENITNIRLNIVGEGIKGDDYLDQINNYISQNKLENYVNIQSFTDNLRSIRSICDIGLICSKNEAFGRVTVETMLSNELAIGANTAGTAELIQDKKTGLLYDEGNYISLSKSIKYAISNTEISSNLASEGFKYAKDSFSINRTVNEIIEVYKKII